MNRSRLTSGQLTMGSSGQTIHDGLPHECSPPLPIKSTTGSFTVLVTYRRLDVSGSSELTTASVRVVELFPVANNTSAIKGEYPGYDVAADSCRFLAPPPEAVDFTLVWSSTKGIGTAAIDGEDDQMLSLIHHNPSRKSLVETMLNRCRICVDHALRRFRDIRRAPGIWGT